VDSVGHVNPLKNLSSSRINSADRYTPLGRQETWEDSPEGYPQTPPYKWWNWHDNYDAEASPDRKWVEVSDAGEAAFRKHDAETKA
jgi:hypothetical protein